MALRIYRALALIFLILLPIQFAIAGYGIFSGKYDAHEAYGAGLLHGITLLMVLTAAIGRLGWKRFGWTFLMFIVFFVQIALVSIGRDNDMLWISGLHPFIAFSYWPFTYFLLYKPAVETSTPTASPPSSATVA